MKKLIFTLLGIGLVSFAGATSLKTSADKESTALSFFTNSNGDDHHDQDHEHGHGWGRGNDDRGEGRGHGRWGRERRGDDRDHRYYRIDEDRRYYYNDDDEDEDRRPVIYYPRSRVYYPEPIFGRSGVIVHAGVTLFGN
ncbi:MAG: hypothetical protein ACYCOO_01025 [Chitinophagaceae bacterium]